ncbi:MAG: hypothetical protein ACTHMV_13465 [Chitinophagaceae bacterium]
MRKIISLLMLFIVSCNNPEDNIPADEDSVQREYDSLLQKEREYILIVMDSIEQFRRLSEKSVEFEPGSDSAEWYRIEARKFLPVKWR